MVSNQNPKQIELDPQSQSRLNCQTLQFKPNTAAQLEEILAERVEQAFRPGSVTDEVVGEIAEQVAADNGDCRQALEMMLNVGRKAEQQGEETITTEFVRTILD